MLGIKVPSIFFSYTRYLFVMYRVALHSYLISKLISVHGLSFNIRVLYQTALAKPSLSL